MRRPIPIYLALCVIVPILCVEHTLGQCQPDVEYAVDAKSQNVYSIRLWSEAPLSSATIQLYDLFLGKVLVEKEIPSLTKVSREVFQNVPPSKYAIIIRMHDCDKPKTLGGIKGISIGIQDL